MKKIIEPKVGKIANMSYQVFKDIDGWTAVFVDYPSLSAGGDTSDAAVEELKAVYSLFSQEKDDNNNTKEKLKGVQYGYEEAISDFDKLLGDV